MNILQFGLVVQENRGVCVCGGGTKKGEGLHVLKAKATDVPNRRAAASSIGH